MDSEKIQKVQDLIDSGMGDVGRNEFILNSLQNGKKLYNTDIKYLENQTQKLNDKITSLLPAKKRPKTTSALSDEEIDKILEQQEKQDAKRKEIPQVIAKTSIKSKIRNIFSRN